MYIPPNTPLKEAELKYYIRQLSPNFIICGDLNGHHQRWEPGRDTRSNTTGNVIHSILEKNNNIILATPPNLPTHTDITTGKTSTIDLCLTSANLYPSTTVSVQTDIASDHYPVLVKVAVGPEKITRGKRRKWIYDETKWTAWKTEVMNTTTPPTQTLDNKLNINSEAENFITDITTPSNEIFKKSSDKLKERFCKPWFNEECKKAAALRKRAKRRMENTQSRGNINEYRRLNASATRIFNTNFRNFWERYLSKLSAQKPMKDNWEIIKKMKGKKRNYNPPLIEGGTYHYTKQERAAIHNNYFKSTMTKRNRRYPRNILDSIQEAKNDRNRFQECDQILTLQEIINAQQNLTPGKAYGTDEVSNDFLLHLPMQKLHQLLGIYNRSWRWGIVPDNWKTGLIIPIAKPRKNPNLPESYRPITLLQCVSKLMENIVSSRLTYIAEENNLLLSSQHGFRARRSTLDPVVELEYEIRKGIAENHVTVVVFFDLKAAYDSVDHKLLLNALAKLGLGGKLLTWIEDFLTNRKISTIVEDYISEALAITQGVPQGSGISCIIFILLLSTLPPTFHPVKSKEFADDVCFSYTAQTIVQAETHMQIAIDMFVSWANNTGLTINVEKTKTMAFSNQGCIRPFLTLNHVEIEPVYTFTYLGITLDAPYLTWGDHVEKLLETCDSGINLMKTMAFSKFGADRKILLDTYCAMIRCKILYSTPALITTCETNLNHLEVLQNKALRIATGALNSTHVASLQCEAHIPPIKIMIKEQGIRYYYKLRSKDETHPIYQYIRHGNNINPEGGWNTRVRKPFTMKILEIIRDWGLPENPIQTFRKYAKIPPWEPLERDIFLDLLNHMTKKGSSPEQLRAESIRTIETRFPNHLRIYTDGSKKLSGPPQETSTTAALYVEHEDPKEIIKGHWRMNPHTSIAGAELSAIEKSLNWINLHGPQDRVPKSAVILTDSKVSLYLIRQRKPKAYFSSTSIIQDHILKLKNQGWNIAFQWVPSHCGLLGNEIADQTANEAHNLGVIDDYHIEMEELKVLLRETALQQWAAHWDTQKLTCSLGNIKPNLGIWSHTSHRKRPIDVVLTRFRLNSTKLNKHMYMFGLKNTRNCENCNLRDTEDVQHVMLFCPKYDENRKIMKDKLHAIGIQHITLGNLLGAANCDETTKVKINQITGEFIEKSLRWKEL